MKSLNATVAVLFLLASPLSGANEAASSNEGSRTLTVTRNGSQPSAKGSDRFFTGSVRVDRLFEPKAPSRTASAYVTFEPGARTAWHSHPLGQYLIVTFGTGWVQQEGGEKHEIKPGDVVWTPPGVKHWHGATVANGMAHIAVQEMLDGKTVEWMEQVSEEQYRR